MLSRQAVQEKEERIRGLVRELQDAERLLFFKEAEKELKDPDTYATLNFIFIAGLHHFYLKRWLYGLVNVSVFWLGIIMLFTGNIGLGILLIVGVSLLELFELFRSQTIVQNYNNKVMEDIYHRIRQARRR